MTEFVHKWRTNNYCLHCICNTLKGVSYFSWTIEYLRLSNHHCYKTDMTNNERAFQTQLQRSVEHSVARIISPSYFHQEKCLFSSGMLRLQSYKYWSIGVYSWSKYRHVELRYKALTNVLIQQIGKAWKTTKNTLKKKGK